MAAPPPKPPPLPLVTGLQNGTYGLINTCSANAKSPKDCDKERRDFLQGMLDDHMSGKSRMPGWMALETRREITRLSERIQPGMARIGPALSSAEQAARAAEIEAKARFQIGLEARMTTFPFGGPAIAAEALGASAAQMKAAYDFGKAVENFATDMANPREGPKLADSGAGGAKGKKGAHVKK